MWQLREIEISGKHEYDCSLSTDNRIIFSWLAESVFAHQNHGKAFSFTLNYYQNYLKYELSRSH